MVLEILLQGDAARHDGCELDVVHGISAGVFGQVFFDDLASNPANPSDKASDGRGVEYRLHELVVRHGHLLREYLGNSAVLLKAIAAKTLRFCLQDYARMNRTTAKDYRREITHQQI